MIVICRSIVGMRLIITNILAILQIKDCLLLKAQLHGSNLGAKNFEKVLSLADFNSRI